MQAWKHSTLKKTQRIRNALLIGGLCLTPMVAFAAEPAEAIAACLIKHPFPKDMINVLPKGDADVAEGNALIWDRDGHLYTTAQLANKAYLGATRVVTLSYYSQYPDIDPAYRATDVTILSFFNKPWRQNIAGVLHSLHGGSNDAIQDRRVKISKVLTETLKDSHQDWKSGLLIHAMGDAYAHTKHEYGDAEVAYGQPFGHAWQNFICASPDDLSREIPKVKYEAYSKELFSILSGTPVKAVELDKVLPYYDRDCISECPTFQGAQLSEPVTKPFDQHVAILTKCINENARKLTKAEVLQAIDAIKR